jgi:Helix-turn-helix.
MIGYENSKIPRLFELMESRKIKAKDVTAATGITSGTLSDYKSGRSTPSGDRLLALANFLKYLPNIFSETMKQQRIH